MSHTPSLSLQALILQLRDHEVTPKVLCEVRYLQGSKYVGEHELGFIYNNMLELKPCDQDDLRPLYVPNPLSEIQTLWANNSDPTSLDGRLTVTMLENRKPIYHLTFRYEGQTYDNNPANKS